MCDFGLEWSKEERDKIIEGAKEVLSSYRTLKRREKMLLQSEIPDIKSPAYSDMPSSQNLSNTSEERMVNYLAAKEESDDLKLRCKEIERSINACHGEDGAYIRMLTLKYIDGMRTDLVCNAINYGETWFYGKGLNDALCLFAETWDFGRLPRESRKRRKRGVYAE